MDFVHDQMLDGRAFRILAVIDQWRRESVCLKANFRLSGRCVGQALDEWAYCRGIKLDFTRPGKPTDNGLCESFNGRLRDECLNAHEFESLEQAQRIIEAWRRDYNDHRPHGSLGQLTPSEYVKFNQVRLSEAARF